MPNGQVILIVIDGLGTGFLPDAYNYGDTGSNTLQTIRRAGLQVNTLNRLGLYAICDGAQECDKITGCYGKMKECSAGKDTVVGHWELSGVITETAFPTYPNGFSPIIIKKLEDAFGRKVIGNVVASGTEIISRLGAEHCRTGYPIVYTSADSVLQIAAHEEVISIEELYEFCEKAREIMCGKDSVGRIVARPFIGQDGNYTRTTNRKDYTISPPENLLDLLTKQGVEVDAVGKIVNVFNNRGITSSVHTNGNTDGLMQTEKLLNRHGKKFVFVNLIDTDMLYGHRNDVEGYRRAVEEIDRWTGKIISQLAPEDLLILTGDHGCDPGYPGTDHTREYPPLMVYGPNIKKGINLGIRSTFSDVSATILDYFDVPNSLKGTSFLQDILV